MLSISILTATIGIFMKLGDIVLDGENSPDSAVIYIVRDQHEILYVGRSWNVELRLAQHLGYANPPSSGAFSEAARDAIPECWDWDVEFIELPQDFLDSGNKNGANYWIKEKEALLIKTLHPKYNTHYNVG
jgi:hypothetical protein